MDKIPSRVTKWENVISSTAKADLLNLKTEIGSHEAILFEDLLQKIESNASFYVVAENADELIDPSLTDNLLEFADILIALGLFSVI